jgi:diguanylate cyclase (GGDEF)-like protein
MFTDRLTQLFSHDTRLPRLGVCVIGLDTHRAIADSLGPRLGEQLLVAVAARLGGYATQAGHLLAHLGGDEFALLVEDTTCADDAAKAADHALTILGEPFHLDGHHLAVQASAGVMEGPAGGGDPADVMRQARASLHWAQADGGSRWLLFDPRRGADQIARHNLSVALADALRRGHFTLHYQPLVHLATGTMLGLEALARWPHPTLGLIPPKLFIGLAEQTGQILPLGLQLLRQACRDAAAWPAITPHPPYVSVNLSAHQIRHVGLAADIAAVLDDTGLPPHRLQLEITEGTAFDTGPHTAATLQSLSALGIQLALDDFGTGFANHINLRTLPLHALKLDASLTSALKPDTVDAKDEAIVANAINLGRLLDLTVTAEGVETPTQAHRLRTMRCDLGQGWHYGRPIPADQATQLLT